MLSRSLNLRKTKFEAICALLWLVLLAEPAFTAESVAWICDGKFGLCRYFNLDTKQEIISARFEEGRPFSEGLAAVRVAGQFGYVNELGEFVIKPQFDLAGQFANGLAEVVIRNKAGVIDRNGDIIVPLNFQRAVPLTKDAILAVEGSWNDRDPDRLVRLEDESIFPLRNAGLYHISGRWIQKPSLWEANVFNRKDQGLILVREPDSKLYGLLAGSGDWVARPEFDDVGRLQDDRAIVRKQVGDRMLSGAVDGQGRLVVPLQSWTLFYWLNGWGIAHSGGKQALVDRDGNIVGGRYFDKVERAEQGDVAKVLINGRWVGIDRSGHIVGNPDNGQVISKCPSGLRVTVLDDNILITDARGRHTASYPYESYGARPTCDEPFPVNVGGFWNFVGSDGRLLFDPSSFKDYRDFTNGYAAVFDGLKWRIIDRSGRFASAVKFDKYLGRSDDVFHVMMAGREVWLTATGDESSRPPVASWILSCGHGLSLVQREGLWGIAEADGSEVIAPRYRAISCFSNGVAWATIDSLRQWCALGVNGGLHEKPRCHTEHYLSVQTHSRPETFDPDPFENSVQWSRAYLEYGTGRRQYPPRWISP